MRRANWLSATRQHTALLVVGLVLMLSAPIRTTAPIPVSPDVHSPLDAAVSVSLATPPAATNPAPALISPVRAPIADHSDGINALTARVIDARLRAALPRTLDLGAVRAPSMAVPNPMASTAGLFGEPRDPSGDVADDGSITGASIAVGAPDVGRRGGIGPATIGTAGSGTASSAMLTGINQLPLHAGFTLAQDTARTGTIHASIQPLDRPG